MFVFKQKTAYEMRISDWSSDVCSSDLTACQARPHSAQAPANPVDSELLPSPLVTRKKRSRCGHVAAKVSHRGWPAYSSSGDAAETKHLARPWTAKMANLPASSRAWCSARRAHDRSEEHTSELQSLMRNSYAVSCQKT